MNSILRPEDFSLVCSKKKESAEHNIVMLFGGSPEIKSRIMQKIRNELLDRGQDTESFVSKFDSNILCAVKDAQGKTIVADGNYFSKLCLYYPSVSEKTFGLDMYLNKDIIKKYRAELISNMNKNESFILRAQKFEKAAQTVKEDLRRLVLPYIDREKISNYIIRFLNKNSIFASEEKTEPEIRRLSCVSSWGIYSDFSEFRNLKKVYTISDSIGLLSEFLLKALSFSLCECGYRNSVFLCGLTNSFEHLIIPELSVGFFTENKNHRYPYENSIAVSTGRFLTLHDEADIKEQKQMNERLLSDFLDESVFSIYEAAHLESQNNAIFDLAFSDKSFNECMRDIMPMI